VLGWHPNAPHKMKTAALTPVQATVFPHFTS
jgi:hypothetical protein